MKKGKNKKKDELANLGIVVLDRLGGVSSLPPAVVL